MTEQSLLFDERHTFAYFCIPIDSDKPNDKDNQALVECKISFGFKTESCIIAVVTTIKHIKVNVSDVNITSLDATNFNTTYDVVNFLYSAKNGEILVGERCDKQNDIVFYKTPLEAINGHTIIVNTTNGQIIAKHIFFPKFKKCIKYIREQKEIENSSAIFSANFSTNFSNIFSKIIYVETTYSDNFSELESIVYLLSQKEKIISTYNSGKLKKSTYFKDNSVIHSSLFENEKVIKHSEYKDGKIYKEMSSINNDVVVLLYIDGVEQKFINNIKVS